MHRIIVVTLVAAAFAAVFLLYPDLDVQISSQFYDEERGFYLAESNFAKSIYYGVRLVCVGIVATLAIQALLIFKKMRSFSFKHYLNQIYFASVLALGPGLLIHNVIKVLFARPRPREIFSFGGDYPFEQIFSLHNHCADCHSFVSGHAAIGFVFVVLGMISHNGKVRTAWTTVAILFGCLIGYARVIAGAHFASDVVFSGIATLLIAYILYIPYNRFCVSSR